MSRLLSVAFALCIRVASAGKPDQEYQQWAAKVYQEDNQEAREMGKAVACSFCQIAANAVIKQTEMNRERPYEERFGEDEIMEVLLELCKSTAPGIAKSIGGMQKDALMICKRTVREHVGDMMDAASLGEDMDTFCKDANVCPLKMNDMMKMLSMLGKAKAEDPGTTVSVDGDDEEAEL